MTFIDEFEQELLRQLDAGDDTDAIVRWATEKVLESYRNGLTAGREGTQVVRKGTSRRRGALGKPSDTPRSSSTKLWIKDSE